MEIHNCKMSRLNYGQKIKKTSDGWVLVNGWNSKIWDICYCPFCGTELKHDYCFIDIIGELGREEAL